MLLVVPPFDQVKFEEAESKFNIGFPKDYGAKSPKTDKYQAAAKILSRLSGVALKDESDTSKEHVLGNMRRFLGVLLDVAKKDSLSSNHYLRVACLLGRVSYELGNTLTRKGNSNQDVTSEERGYYQEAVDVLSEALDREVSDDELDRAGLKRDDFLQATFCYGLALSGIEDFKKSETVLRGLMDDPKNKGWLNKAHYWSLNWPPIANQDFNKDHIKVHAEWAMYYDRGYNDYILPYWFSHVYKKAEAKKWLDRADGTHASNLYCLGCAALDRVNLSEVNVEKIFKDLLEDTSEETKQWLDKPGEYRRADVNKMLAGFMYRSNNFRGAADVYKNMLESSDSEIQKWLDLPGSFNRVDVKYKLGNTLYRSNDYSAAVAVYGDLLEDDDVKNRELLDWSIGFSLAGLKMEFGKALCENGNYKDAIVVLKGLLEDAETNEKVKNWLEDVRPGFLDGRYAKVGFYLGKALFEEGRYKEAVSQFNKTRYYHVISGKRVEDYLSNSNDLVEDMKQDMTPEAQEQFEAAKTEFESKEYKAANDILSVLDSDHPQVACLRGRTLYALDDFAVAAEVLGRALKKFKGGLGNNSAVDVLGKACEEGDDKKGLPESKRDDLFYAALCYGRALVKNEKYNWAVGVLNELLKGSNEVWLNKDDGLNRYETQYSLGTAYFKKGDYKKAITAFGELLRDSSEELIDDSKRADIYKMLGEAMIEAKDYNGAVFIIKNLLDEQFGWISTSDGERERDRYNGLLETAQSKQEPSDELVINYDPDDVDRSQPLERRSLIKQSWHGASGEAGEKKTQTQRRKK